MNASRFCLGCTKRSICKEICKELEKRLGRRDIAGYTDRHRRRKEVIVDTQEIEGLANKRAFELRYGKGYFKPKGEEMD